MTHLLRYGNSVTGVTAPLRLLSTRIEADGEVTTREGGELIVVMNIHQIYSRLAETIAWCQFRANISDPKESLRTPVLRPANLSSIPNQWGNYDYDWDVAEQVQATVDALAYRRANLLQAESLSFDASMPDLQGGRLLIAAPNESDWCCLSEAEAEGFIDALDVPAWDTWICYLREATTPDAEVVRRTQEAFRSFYNRPFRQNFVDWQPPTSVEYLLCWVPPQFVSLTEAGIMVNPVQCLFWARNYRRHHYNTESLRQLEAAGLLT